MGNPDDPRADVKPHISEYEVKEVFLVDDPPFERKLKIADFVRSIVIEVLEEMGYDVPKK